MESGIGDLRILCGTFLFSVWVFECLSWSEELELESGVFENNQDKRSARGADPTAARTPLATRLSRSLGLSRYNRGSRAVRDGYAYAAHYARVIPVIAHYLNPAGRRMLATMR